MGAWGGSSGTKCRRGWLPGLAPLGSVHRLPACSGAVALALFLLLGMERPLATRMLAAGGLQPGPSRHGSRARARAGREPPLSCPLAHCTAWLLHFPPMPLPPAWPAHAPLQTIRATIGAMKNMTDGLPARCGWVRLAQMGR